MKDVECYYQKYAERLLKPEHLAEAINDILIERDAEYKSSPDDDVLDKVVASGALANFKHWRFRQVPGQGKGYGIIVGDCTKRFSIEFKKFWKEEGAELMAKWLWRNNRAYTHKDRKGLLVVVDANEKKGNKVFYY